MLNEYQENLIKAEDERKINIVHEENPMTPKDPESLIKIEQQYLKFYKVPVQYRKIFGIVINRLNHFYQVRGNLSKKANKHNDKLFDNLLHSEQKLKDIMYYINNLVTKKYIDDMFDKKWNTKQKEKIQKIQSLC